MKILIFNHYAIPPSQGGGTRHHSLACELISRNHKVHIIASSFNHATLTETCLYGHNETSKCRIENGVPFVWIKTTPYKGNSLSRILNMLCYSIRVEDIYRIHDIDKPDIIIGSSPHPFAAYSAARLSSKLKIPFILEIRDLWPATLVDLGKISAMHPFVIVLKKLESHLYRSANKIITLLPGLFDYLKERQVGMEKIKYLPNGLNIDLIPKPSFPSKRNDFKIIYAGSHGMGDALESILDVAIILQKEGLGDTVRFRLIGDGPEKAKLQHIAAEKKITNVFFENPVPKENLYHLLQEADAFIVTMRNSNLYKYGISFNKIYDYMASARPVLIFCSPNLYNNSVEEANAGLSVLAEDSHAMADAIKKLLFMTPEERWEMGLRGRRYVEKNHNFKDIVIGLEKILLDAIDNK